MSVIQHLDTIESQFNSLIKSLSGKWPDDKLSYVRNGVLHSEYSDALENLVATYINDDLELNIDDLKMIAILALEMDSVEDIKSLIQFLEKEGLSGKRPKYIKYNWFIKMSSIYGIMDQLERIGPIDVFKDFSNHNHIIWT